MKKIIVKIGTNVITKDNGLLNMPILQSIVKQIANLRKKGVDVIIVSSGAMGAGRSLVKLDNKTSDIVKRQVLASIGQVELLHTYLELFKKEGFLSAQVLATKEDFRDRMHYLNMKNCFEGLLSNGITPIVNENDVISVDELMFTDNDELAGLIASMIDADAAILLTTVEGIYTCNINNKPTNEVIKSVNPGEAVGQCILPGTSLFGRGGMKTKVKIAEKLADMGITTYVANGQTKNVITDIFANKKVGTKFVASKSKKTSSLKRWIAHSEGYEKGVITIDAGAEKVLKKKISSLLPVGITKIEGEFKKGDIVKILNRSGKKIGYGIAAYGSKTAKSYIGKKGKKALIHYDYLVLQS